MYEKTDNRVIALLEENVNLLRRMNEREDSMFRLQAMTALAGKPQREQIERLRDFGFQPRHIAQIVGVSANSVRVALTRLKKSRKKKV